MIERPPFRVMQVGSTWRVEAGDGRCVSHLPMDHDRAVLLCEALNHQAGALQERVA